MVGYLFTCWTILLVLSLNVAPARACPFCNSSVAERVRAGIFNEEFFGNMARASIPFFVFGCVVALLHFGLPPWRVAVKPHSDLPAQDSQAVRRRRNIKLAKGSFHG